MLLSISPLILASNMATVGAPDSIRTATNQSRALLGPGRVVTVHSQVLSFTGNDPVVAEAWDSPRSYLSQPHQTSQRYTKSYVRA
ncbi:hypothetical protein CPB86DRAFT_389639 [Serendipita vermifera]|nr:hypothetical protein CPB86DRAFT_389639 [Serendipita vermifera]